MFLAQILWESTGLMYKKEIACQNTQCPDRYRSKGDDPNKFYYGRGYLELTWSWNYRSASIALFGDERLVENPDLVSDNEDIAWATAFWYWRTYVHDAPGVQERKFGATTK